MEINRNELISVGTSAQVISVERNNNNGKRSTIAVINTSTGGQLITIAMNDQAISGYGIQLNPGGIFQDSQDAGYYPTQTQITAISSAAGGQISLQERVIL